MHGSYVRDHIPVRRLMKKILFGLLFFASYSWADIPITSGNGDKTVKTSTVDGKEIQIIAIYESSNTVTPAVGGNAVSASNPLPVQSTGTISVIGNVDSLTTFIHKYEYSGSSLTYHGIAAPGSGTSSNVWRLMKYQYNGVNVSDILFSSGTANFIHQWDLRATYTYQ